MNDADWTTEALRLFHRYEEEVVQTYGLCPWAEPSRRNGSMRERVLLQTDVSTKPSREALAALALDADVEVAVLIYPRIGLGFSAFERFVATVRDEDAQLHPLGAIPFAMAAFHPDARADRSTPERLIPFLRRTPDPTIQIVRSEVLERVRSGAPQGTSFVNPATFDIAQPAQAPLRERIARSNLAKVDAVGIEEVTRRLDDIGRDRDATYRDLVTSSTEPHERRSSPSGGSGTS